MASETTPLTSGDESRTYLFVSQRHRNRRTRIRQFQCCVCAAMLGIFVTAMVVTVSYSMNHDPEDDINNNDTEPNGFDVFQPLTSAQTPLKTLLTLSWPRPEVDQPMWRGPTPTDSEVAAALEEGETSLKAKDLLETRAYSQQNDSGSPGILQLGSPSYTHQQAVKTTPEAIKAARVGYVIGVATEKLISKKLISRGSVGQGPQVHAYWLPTGMICKGSDDPGQETSNTECPPSPYRTMDGTCNNLVHPEWGVAMRPIRRVLPPDYGDGISSPRLAKDGSQLPSARDVSLTVHRPIYRNDPNFTVMLAVWGQFFDHDITATALSKSKDGAPIACCTKDGKIATGKLHPECYPVILSPEDPYYSTFGMTCMEFVRSAPAPTCNFGPREQLNQITSYIDGSVVYGSSEEQAMRLRSPNGKGELHMLLTPDNRELLPPSTDPRDGCNTPEMNKEGKYCFMAGDNRANENMHLTTMHLLLARQHNRLVRALTQINPSWSDEQLYQEGRRILSAQIQHITYNEFLPVILGPSLMDRLKLAPLKDGYFEGYDPQVNTDVGNNFATAAFRFAHTLLPTLMRILGNDTSSEEYIELHKMLFNPYALYYPGKMDGAIEGALNTDIQKVDTYLTPEVTQHLFQQRWSEDYDKAQEKAGNRSEKTGKKRGYGLDLASINVQRGRDHGLPSYPKWREFCGMTHPKSFSDLQGQMDDAALQRLATLYKSVDDVDMYSGSLSEVPIGEGLLGPTFSCLIADQFLRLKIGDRYWYETSQQPQAFTPEQLTEIRKTSLASLICDNSGVEHAQLWVMRTVNPSNPRMPCTSIPRLQLQVWEDKSMVGHVKLSTPSVRARVIPEPQKAENITPPNKPFASMFIKGTVVTASLTATDSDGNSRTVLEPSSSFPKTIPAHLFDQRVSMSNVTTVNNTNGMIPTFYNGGGGVSWTGSLTSTGPMEARLKGTFSVPLFKHGATQLDFSVSTYTGDFDITINLLGNLSSYGLPEIQGTYNSGIYFQTELSLLTSSSPSTKEMFETVAGKSGSKVPKAPLLLYGSYDSLDPTAFHWNGNVSLILPAPTMATLTESDDGMNKWVKTKSSSTSVDVSVVWGVVTAVSSPAPGDGSGGTKTVVTTWWDGSFPVAITQPAFDRITSNSTLTVPPLTQAVNSGGGVTWSGSLSPVASSITGDVQLNGTYSFPVFLHGERGKLGEPSGFAEKIWRGNFSLILRPSLADKSTPLTSSLHLLAAGGQFKSPVIFQSNDHVEEMATPNDFTGDLNQTVPVILSGYTSLDKSVFFWTGNATICIPQTLMNTQIEKGIEGHMEESNKGKLFQSYKSLKAPGGNFSSAALDLTILSASVNITISTSPKIPGKKISWNGEFPVTFPQPAFYRSKPSDVLKAYIDTGYPYTPLAKPTKSEKYNSTITWSNLSAQMIDLSTTDVQINGSFNFPIFYFGDAVMGVWKGPSVENWNGIFSCIFNTTSTEKDISAINSFLSIISKSYFTSDVYFVEESKVKDSGTLGTNLSETDSDSLDPQKLTILLRGSKSPDKTEFYWNGAATLLIPSSLLIESGDYIFEAISATKKLVDKSHSYFSGTVASGMVMASSSKRKVILWNGDLPLSISMPVFDSVSPDAGVYTWPYEPTFFNGTGGVTWIGSMARTSAVKNGIIMKGSFSVPVFIHGNPSVFEIEEWNGDFSLEISLYVNHTVNGLMGEGNYKSPIIFRERQSKFAGSEESLETDMEMISQVLDIMALSSTQSLGGTTYSSLPRAPVILWGNFSNNKTTFYWTGNISVIFPSMPSTLSSSLESTSTNTKVKKQANNVFTELYKGKRLKLALKVLSGSITASSASFGDQALWDGTLPITFPTLVFRKFSIDTSFVGGPVTWTGHFAPSGSIENGANVEGSFSIPMLVRSNISTMSFETWTGDFSFVVSINGSENIKDLLPSTGPFVSRIILGVAYPDVEASLEESNIQAKNNPLKMTINDFMESIASPGSDSTTYATVNMPIFLQGEFYADKKTFSWNGDAIAYLPEPPPITYSDVLGSSKMKFQSPSLLASLPTHKKVLQKMFGYVTAGSISGGIQEGSTSTLWSGSYPTRIPMPAFDRFSNSTEPLDPNTPLSQRNEGGVTWELTAVSPIEGGIHLEGNFFFPIYIHGKLGTFSITVWTGRFSFNAILPGDQSINGMLNQSARYRSPVYFHHSRSEWDPLNLNDQMPGNEGPVEAQNNPGIQSGKILAKKSPILILKGKRDKSTFFWSGKFIVVFPNN